jgi:hypothetical protein
MSKKIHRPTAITLICLMGFGVSVIGFPGIFSPFVKKKGDWFPALSGMITALEFIAVVGTWYMKKWGGYLYLMSALAAQIVALLIDNWSPIKAIIPAVYLCVYTYHSRKMDANL